MLIDIQARVRRYSVVYMYGMYGYKSNSAGIMARDPEGVYHQKQYDNSHGHRCTACINAAQAAVHAASKGRLPQQGGSSAGGKQAVGSQM